jgi:single stranded DNA-binding protein
VLNQVVLSARLAADPKLYNAGQDNERCNMRVAFNETTGRDSNGEIQTAGRFIDVAVFGRSAGACAHNLVKGQEVVISGRLTQRETGKDASGQYDRAIFSVIANPIGGVTFGRRAGEGAASNGQATQPQAAAAAAQSASDDPPPF